MSWFLKTTLILLERKTLFVHSKQLKNSHLKTCFFRIISYDLLCSPKTHVMRLESIIRIQNLRNYFHYFEPSLSLARREDVMTALGHMGRQGSVWASAGRRCHFPSRFLRLQCWKNRCQTSARALYSAFALYPLIYSIAQQTYSYSFP